MLLLYGEPRLTPAIITVDTAIRATLESRSPMPVTFYTEYLDLALFPGAAPLPEMRELLRLKYESRPLDLIIAAASPSLRIALRNRAALFSNAPVVFIAVDPAAAADLQIDGNITGTWLHQGWTETLELARRLQPDLRRIVVINGSSSVDRVWWEAARARLGAAGSTEVVFLSDLGIDDILATVRSLPKHSAVLFGVFLRDANGRDFRPDEALRQIAHAASVPVYGLTEVALGTGAVGGHVVSFEAHAKMGAELTLRMLAGERPPPTGAGTSVFMLDARQLARWGFDPGRLPSGSRILFDEPSMWARYRWYIVGLAAAFLIQSGSIAGLLIHRAQRHRTQRSLAERLRFETLLSNLSSRFAASSALDAELSIQSGLQLIGEGLTVDWVAVRLLEDHGNEARLAQAWTRDGVAPRPPAVRDDQAPWILDRIRHGHVVRVTRLAELPDEAAPDRGYLQALPTGSLVVLPLVAGNAVLGLLSVGMVREERAWSDDLIARLQILAELFANALERRRAALAEHASEAQIRDLAGRLMTAQEEERRRIARDLHDDINQELAAQSIALSTLGDRLPGDTSPAVRAQVAQLQARTVELAKSVRHLSHSLHPGNLEHAGLVSAFRSYCRRFEGEHGLRVTFAAEGDLGSVPPDVALCLYRVTQEGLGNVARHAQARHARVAVRREGNDVVLTIGDDGRGFDLAEARRRQGLGLVSLDERVRVVGGNLTIDSHLQRGTELRIVVPLSEVRDAPTDRVAR